MSNISKIPFRAFELFSFRPWQQKLIETTLALIRASGIWEYSQKRCGDVAHMNWIDKLYWLYKAQTPIKKPRKGSQLKEYFDRQAKINPKPIPGFEAQSTIELSAVGDLINHAQLSDSPELYEDVADLIFDVDFSMANLECPVFEKSHLGFEFSFRYPPPLYYKRNVFDIVKGQSESKKYDFMATACNHSLDFGQEAVMNTIKTLEENQISYHGVNKSHEHANQALIKEVKNIKLGIISFTFGLNARTPPKEHEQIVNVTDLNRSPDEEQLGPILKQIEHAKKNNVDFIILQLHWGLEHEFYPMPEQVELARELAERGADAIIGHHPHVIQPMELYTTKRDVNRMVPIYYSLGNLINAFSAEELCQSAVVRLSLTKGMWNNHARTYVNQAKIKRVQQTLDANKKLRLKPLDV